MPIGKMMKAMKIPVQKFPSIQLKLFDFFLIVLFAMILFAATTRAAAAQPLAAASAVAASAPVTVEPDEEVEEPVTSDVVLQNEFIKIIANANAKEMGRFSVLTVKGDPKRAEDDNKMLNYGRARPWTSYTTVRIDGENYAFGGSTERRSGKSARVGGVVTRPHVENDALVTEFNIGGVIVTQTLTFAAGPISNLYDTMKITYTFQNPDGFAHRVGLRILLDTLLGTNDGAPFRVGSKRITRELQFTGGEIPPYWIAFDSLDDPQVISRGTLRGEGLTPPDSLTFANWGKFADHPWNAPYTPRQSFIRAGEAELDSAMALQWNEMELPPGGSRSFSTLYGIEYLNIAGDILSIGTLPTLGNWPTAPNQITTYTLYAFVGNTVDFDLNDVQVRLDLPAGVVLAESGDGVRRYKKLKSGEEVTAGWQIKPEPFSGADDAREINIVGSARQVKQVKVATKVTLLAAPEVKLQINAPDHLELIDGKEYGPTNPFLIEVRCGNTGLSPIDNLRLSLDLPHGLRFPEAQKPEKTFNRLGGRDEVVFLWKVIADGEDSGDLVYTIQAVSDSTEKKSETFKISVPALPIKVEWQGVPESTKAGVFLPAEVFASNLKDFGAAAFDVSFDPAVVRVVRVSQGTAFIEGLQATPWTEPVIDNRAGMVRGIRGDRGGSGFNGHGSLAVIHFQTLASGDAKIHIKGMELTGTGGTALPFNLEEKMLTVGK